MKSNLPNAKAKNNSRLLIRLTTAYTSAKATLNSQFKS